MLSRSIIHPSFEAISLENVDIDGNIIVERSIDEKVSQDVEMDGVNTMTDDNATASVYMNVKDGAGTHEQESTQHELVINDAI